MIQSAKMHGGSDGALSPRPNPCCPQEAGAGPSGGSGGALHRSFLPLPEPEAWRVAGRQGLTPGSRSCSLQVPPTVSGSVLLLPRAATFDVAYTRDGVSAGLGAPPLSPGSIMRRRGGIVDQRDVVRAHQAHKIQSTPQARRKEWE